MKYVQMTKPGVNLFINVSQYGIHKREHITNERLNNDDSIHFKMLISNLPSESHLFFTLIFTSTLMI
jgi:hypothetical protein